VVGIARQVDWVTGQWSGAANLETQKVYVVISGVLGSGKSTLARRLAPLLGLPLIDKDDILESLFARNGIRRRR
jgi:ABC-type proline/glycine betaine transport system ATPase subunit